MSTYSSWYHMKERCNNPKCAVYSYYGGLDITYTERWEYYHNFLADMRECPEGLELDRKDNNGHYTKENCRWATRAQQVQNSSKAKLNEEQVKEIRALLKGACSRINIAKQFNVSKSCIKHIAARRTWKNCEP